MHIRPCACVVFLSFQTDTDEENPLLFDSDKVG